MQLAKARIKLGNIEAAKTELSSLFQDLTATGTTDSNRTQRLLAAHAGTLLGEVLIMEEQRDEAEKTLEEALDILPVPTNVVSPEITETRFQLYYDLALCLGRTPR